MILKFCQLHYQYLQIRQQTEHTQHFFAFSEHYTPYSNNLDLANLLEIKRQIYKICKQHDWIESTRVCGDLFDSLYNVGQTKVNAKGKLETFDYQVNYEVFTTNYDLSFSKFLEYGTRIMLTVFLMQMREEFRLLLIHGLNVTTLILP